MKLALLGVLGVSGATGFATGPQIVHYQGRLLDGTNLYQGSVDIQLLLYTNLTGGVRVYEDTGTVDVVDGLYATDIGDGTVYGTWPDVLTNQPLFLEVVLKSTVLSPREPLGSVAYALRADVAGGVAAGSITASMLAEGAVTGSKLATGAVAAANLAAGAITSDKLGAGAVTASALASNAVTTDALADGAVTAGKIVQAQGIALSASWFAPQPTNALSFGSAVAAVGTNIVVGAVGIPPGTTNKGAAYVFNADGGLIAVVTNPVNAATDFGLPVVACGTTRFAVAASRQNVGLVTNAGVVHLYSAAGAGVAVINNPNPSTGGQFGLSLAPLGADRLLVGAPNNFSGTGAVYVCNLAGAVVQTIHEPLNTPNAQFGWSVTAIGTNRIAVTALAAGGGVGRVDVFTTAGAYLYSIGNPSGVFDYFGYSLSGWTSNRLAIGVPLGGTNGMGMVRVFDNTGASLGVIHSPAAPGIIGYFGLGLAASPGGDLLVGSPLTAWGRGSGAAYWYDSATNLLGRITHPNAPAAQTVGAFACFVPSNRVALGCPVQTAAGYVNAGAVYFYELETHAGIVADHLPAFSVTADQLAPEVADQFVQRAGDTMSGALMIDQTGNFDSPRGSLHVKKGYTGANSIDANSIAVFENTGSTYLSIVARTNDESGIVFTTPAISDDAGILFNTPSLPHGLTFRTGGNSTKLVIASNGYVGVGVSVPTNRIHVVGGAQCNGTTWLNASDRNLKENLAPVDGAALLELVGRLPVYSWNYRDVNPGSRHIGPMAQDFYSVFGVGDNDTTISTIDPEGIALAAIQALKKDADEKDARIEELQRQVDALHQQLQQLSR